MSSEQPPNPAAAVPPDAAAPREREHWARDEAVTARVRKVPKYRVFLVLGFGLGVVVALILTFVFGGSEEASQVTGARYSPIQVFGFLALGCGVVGMGLAGCVALILDRVIARRARTVIADRESVVDG